MMSGNIKLLCKCHVIVVFVLSFFSFSVDSFAAEARLQINGPTNSLELIGYIESFLDESGELTVEQVSSQEYANKFNVEKTEFIDHGERQSR